MSRFFTLWKIRFLQRWLGSDLNLLSSLNTGKRCMVALRELRHTRESRAQQFKRERALRSFYMCFSEWREIVRVTKRRHTRNVRIALCGKVFREWVRYMCRKGDQLQRVIEAQKFHYRVLKARVLFAFYRNALEQRRLQKV